MYHHKYTMTSDVYLFFHCYFGFILTYLHSDLLQVNYFCFLFFVKVLAGCELDVLLVMVPSLD